MKNHNFEKSALRTIKTEIQAINSIKTSIGKSFTSICEQILDCKGQLIVIGVGKSAHIGKKIAASLSSTGTPAYMMHATEAAHGDLGMISKKDDVLILSNSGETAEIIAILPALKRAARNIYSFTGNRESTIAKNSKQTIVVKIKKEACPNNLAPTSSTTAMLVLGDALTVALLEANGFSSKDFAKSHPAGTLGKRLTTLASDLAITGKDIAIVLSCDSIIDAAIEITEKKLGIALVKGSNGRIIGVFSDGDLRRAVKSSNNLHSAQVRNHMSKHFVTVKRNSLAMDALKIMENKKILSVVVKDSKDKNYIGLLTMHSLLESGIV
ncbi:MAG: KpsF/GutQ family sugar-phosphate isomerase [Gammaproteobacteria bacterium]